MYGCMFHSGRGVMTYDDGKNWCGTVTGIGGSCGSGSRSLMSVSVVFYVI